ncbi:MULTISPECIES: CRISPR-associated protein Cas4 [unclassified Crossiella]|uniref:CRISPR-associated protein Cas4 n=1 Tax=unclassified Crossiella TaxID=2620835 RepID=UPI001FFF63AF|nr:MULTISPECIES: CRISPR-associated protein Cas4 [unclassified Crossiella]MCK2245199.1 CRISPR-associated protein Cas4 [Crossiella sp. S99.2]MCK2258879.1 CRISPR-associated protein Cas4 [Crossiella sp. S99.1]
MISRQDIGGVHIKYLYHCRRQLWLYSRGIRPEYLSDTVAYGSAVHDTTYPRYREIDLGAARLDHLDGQAWVHEVKSSRTSTPADAAQARHYCYRLDQLGVQVHGAILHHPATRRTHRLPYTDTEATQADADITTALEVITQPESPPKPGRSRCHRCSFHDYCWTD